jgi:hypothetical protein
MGQLPAEAIQAVVLAAYPGLRDCYRAALAVDPAIAGTAMTSFVIQRDGRVTGVSTSVTGSLPLSVAACVEARFREMGFPAPDGGIVTVTFPIRYSPGR